MPSAAVTAEPAPAWPMPVAVTVAPCSGTGSVQVFASAWQSLARIVPEILTGLASPKSTRLDPGVLTVAKRETQAEPRTTQ